MFPKVNVCARASCLAATWHGLLQRMIKLIGLAKVFITYNLATKLYTVQTLSNFSSIFPFPPAGDYKILSSLELETTKSNTHHKSLCTLYYLDIWSSLYLQILKSSSAQSGSEWPHFHIDCRNQESYIIDSTSMTSRFEFQSATNILFLKSVNFPKRTFENSESTRMFIGHEANDTSTSHQLIPWQVINPLKVLLPITTICITNLVEVVWPCNVHLLKLIIIWKQKRKGCQKSVLNKHIKLDTVEIISPTIILKPTRNKFYLLKYDPKVTLKVATHPNIN